MFETKYRDANGETATVTGETVSSYVTHLVIRDQATGNLVPVYTSRIISRRPIKVAR